ncbi:hypothetical protein BKA65DRAFT_195657 [Rhexocercosporidium sp. MPI-PUGE-AT-0058]|nr:hypothetical protein BKA65DRAFT_195657 [Rhexocercosporidium sp. MPI-PUGE-AT-0058]
MTPFLLPSLCYFLHHTSHTIDTKTPRPDIQFFHSKNHTPRYTHPRSLTLTMSFSEQTLTMAQSHADMPDTKLEPVMRHRVNSKMDLVSMNDTCDKIEKSIIPSNSKAASSIAFAIDIDGVLFKYKGEMNRPLPGALATLKRLQDLQIPLVLLTNRMYCTPEFGLEELRKTLGLPSLSPSQLINPITPFKLLVPQFGRKPVLVIGHASDPNRSLAESLGFTDVYTPEDFYEVYPKLAPKAFSSVKPSKSSPRAKKLHEGRHTKGPHVEISAILVFGCGSQVFQDEDVSPNKLLVQILKSHSGDLRIESRANGKNFLPNKGYQQTYAPKVYYEACHPRYRHFRALLEHAWKAETGRPLLHQIEVGGKPAAPMYHYAEKMLREHQRELHGDDADALEIEKVVMIDDTPEYDMRCVNLWNERSGKGDKWRRVLVASGAHDFVREGLPGGDDRPDSVADDFSEAVVAALDSHGVYFGTIEDSEDAKDSGGCEWQDREKDEDSENDGDSQSDEDKKNEEESEIYEEGENGVEPEISHENEDRDVSDGSDGSENNLEEVGFS